MSNTKSFSSETSDRYALALYEIGKENKTASVALYARYLKRIGAHLKNITSSVVNPFESIGYNK